ncbi:hypothetical protein [Pantoea ananatis]|uniref:hypothetical protein n=1 Tax=Pantoea ananas TaxID=553 RepID=UPI003019ACA3
MPARRITQQPAHPKTRKKNKKQQETCLHIKDFKIHYKTTTRYNQKEGGYMKVLIDIEDSVVREILNHADENDEDMEFEDIVSSLLSDAVNSKKTKTLSDDEINEVIHQMISFAIKNSKENKSFKANELYFKALDESWSKLSPSTRKSLGRRFRTTANELWDKAAEGELVVEFQNRNINNAAVYEVVKKVDL